MNLEGIAEANPHLKEVIELYAKIRELEGLQLAKDYSLASEERSTYGDEDADRILGEFKRIFGAGDDEIAGLGEILRSGDLDFMQLPQSEAEQPDSESGGSEAPSVIYIISRPFFKAVSKTLDMSNVKWEEGRCPLCNAAPALSIIEKDTGRKYHCSFCGTTGPFRRIGCPFCNTDRAEDIDIMMSEEFEGIRLEACTKCKTYIKSVAADRLVEHDIMELDLVSLPLDIIAQKKGFVRRSPNPTGITRFD